MIKAKVVNIETKNGVSKTTGNPWTRHHVKLVELVDNARIMPNKFIINISDYEMKELQLQKGDILSGSIFVQINSFTNVDGTTHESNDVRFVDIVKHNSENMAVEGVGTPTANDDENEPF